MTATAVSPNQDAIRHVFDRLSGRYDLFNCLTSMGLDTIWRRKALGMVKTGMRILDLGCGTGDLMIEAARRLQGRGEVVGLDFSKEMLNIAKRRAADSGCQQGVLLRFEHRRAEEIPFEDEGYDLAVSGFVLRNIYENIDEILGGVFQSLRSGGQISFLDFTEPPGPVRKKLWHWYMNHVAAFYGKILFGENFPLFYMTDSAQRFLKAPEFMQQLRETGFEEVTAQKFMMGIIVLYRAKKPAVATNPGHCETQRDEAILSTKIASSPAAPRNDSERRY